MGFGQLGFLWTFIIPIFVLLYYFFRKKYKEQPISSTLFWETVMKETKVSPYLQYLQRNALFYLQMLALILLVLSLIQPYMKTRALAGEQIIWMVDTSASMLAGSNNDSVFDQHKREMLALSEQLEGKPVTLLTMGEEPTILLREERDLSVIQSAIHKLEVEYEQEHLSKMLDFTQSLVKGEDTVVYLFTDSVERSELPLENESLSWIVKGSEESLENVSILRFGATQTKQSISALAQLVNNTAKEKSGQFLIHSIDDDELLYSETVSIPSNDTLSLSMKDIPIASGLKATLKINDDYTIDNESTVLLQSQTSQTFVDSQLHQLVTAAFQAMSIPVSSVPSEQVSELSEDGLIVTNQSSLLEKAPSPVLIIGRNDETAHEVNGVVTTEKDDVFAYASMDDLYVSSLYPPFKSYETIARVNEEPFIQRSDRGDLIILSDVQMTDWPLHPSFPLFLWSAKEQMSKDSDYLGIFSPKEKKSISLVADEEDEEWEVFSQSDEYISSVQQGGQFSAPAKPGIYSLKSGDEEKQFMVLLEQKEKEIRTGTSFTIGTSSDTNLKETIQTPLVAWFLLLIVLLLLAEWEVQRRRGLTN
ncbi:MAG: BatA and WFA domain-containing protein [Paenisporosarcina sp.]